MPEIVAFPYGKDLPEDVAASTVEDVQSKISKSIELIDNAIRHLDMVSSQSKIVNMDSVVAGLSSARRALIRIQKDPLLRRSELRTVFNRLDALNRSLRPILSAFQAERELVTAPVLQADDNTDTPLPIIDRVRDVALTIAPAVADAAHVLDDGAAAMTTASCTAPSVIPSAGSGGR